MGGAPWHAALVALVALAALAPWLALAPLGGAAAVAANAVALAAALHGYGLVVARVARRPDVHPMLAIQWGAAAAIGLFGVAVAAGIAHVATQAVLLYAGAAVHTAALALRLRHPAFRARVAAARPRLSLWLPAAGLLAVAGAFHVLGAAGDAGARPFDDDGHVLAQLQRLRETGALGDPIGYARDAQLGGQLALQALATLGGDVHLARAAEALALVLAVGLALARLTPPGEPDAASGLWRLLLVIAAAAFTYDRTDPAAMWTAVGLVLALHATLADRGPDGAAPPPLVPTGLLAGALAALRLELLPLAAAALVAAFLPRRTRRAAATLAAAALAICAPYAIARALAWSSVPDAARALVEPASGPLGLRLAIAAGVALACAPIAILAWGQPALRWLAAGAALTIGGIAGGLTGERAYAVTFLWPLAIAGGLALAVEVARHRRAVTAALLVSLFAVVLIHEGRTATGRRRWTRRYYTLAENITYLRHAALDAPVGGGYAPVLAAAPPGATVAVWVTRPERLDYAAHRIIDLRTPRAAWMRELHAYPHPPWLERLLAHVRADFLLLEADDHARARAARYRIACAASPERCVDDLDALARRLPAAAEAPGLRLLDLRPLRPLRPPEPQNSP